MVLESSQIVYIIFLLWQSFHLKDNAVQQTSKFLQVSFNWWSDNFLAVVCSTVILSVNFWSWNKAKWRKNENALASVWTSKKKIVIVIFIVIILFILKHQKIRKLTRSSKLAQLKEETFTQVYMIYNYTTHITISTAPDNKFTRSGSRSSLHGLNWWKKRYLTSEDIHCLLLSKELISN